MNYWKMIYTRWSRESISTWSSLKKTAYIILPLLVYFLVHDAVEVLLWAVLNQFMLICRQETTSFLNANSYTVRGMINGTAILFGVAAIWQAVKREISNKEQTDTEIVNIEKDAKQLKRTEANTGDKSHNEKMITSYMVLGVLAFLSAWGLNVLFYLLGITESSQSFENTANAQFGVNFFAGLILYGILSPLAEEAVFRGLMYNRMKRCFNIPIALIVSSLLFGCYHGNLVQAAYGTLLGLLIAYTYEKYHSFAAPVLFHAVANISIFTMTYNNRLNSMDKRIGIAVTVITLAGAGVCLWIIKKNYGDC